MPSMVMVEVILGSVAPSVMVSLVVPAWVMVMVSSPLPASQSEWVAALLLALSMASERLQVASTWIQVVGKGVGVGVLVSVGVGVLEGVGVKLGVGVWLGVRVGVLVWTGLFGPMYS